MTSTRIFAPLSSPLMSLRTKSVRYSIINSSPKRSPQISQMHLTRCGVAICYTNFLAIECLEEFSQLSLSSINFEWLLSLVLSEKYYNTSKLIHQKPTDIIEKNLETSIKRMSSPAGIEPIFPFDPEKIEPCCTVTLFVAEQ